MTILKNIIITLFFLLLVSCESSGGGSDAGSGDTSSSTSPVIQIYDTNITEQDSGFAIMVFSIFVNTASIEEINVDYATMDGTATEGSDYTPASGTLTIAPGNTFAVICVAVNGDTYYELDETLNMTLSNPIGATLNTTNATGTIVSDDFTMPLIQIGNASITELDSDSNNIVFSISLDTPSGAQTTFDYTTSDGSATAASDYTAASGTLIIEPGDTSASISVEVNGDNDIEADEIFSIILSNPVGATLDTPSANGTIISDDLPQVYFLGIPTAITEGNSGTADMAFYINMMPAVDWDVSFDFATSDNTASEGSDYIATSSNVTIPAGDTSVQVNVAVIGDTISELNEIITATLSNAVNATFFFSTTKNGTIINDDLAIIDVADASLSEGNSGQSMLDFNVTMTGLSSDDVTVDFDTSDIIALADIDYANTSGTLTIPSGSSTGTISIPVYGDTDFELDETFTITLTNPSVNAVIGIGTATGTIDNDDAGLPVVHIDDAEITEGDSGTISLDFVVRLSAPLGTEVTFDYNTADITAEPDIDYNSASLNQSIAAGDTSAIISIIVYGDSLIEYDETLGITLSNLSLNAVMGDDEATGTINNDDHFGRLNNDTYAVTQQKTMVFNEDGDGLAVWVMFSGTRQKIIYSYYSSSTGTWASEERIAPLVSLYQAKPAVATDGKRFMVVWLDQEIRAKSFDGSTWSSETILSDTLEPDPFAPIPKIASNGSSYLVVWRHKDVSTYSIYNCYFDGTSWSLPSRIENDINSTNYPNVASNGSNYLVAYHQSSTTNTTIDTNIFDGTTWNGIYTIGSISAVSGIPCIASNGTGYAVSWQHASANMNIYVRLYDGFTWSSGTLLSDNSLDNPSLASDGTNYAVVWSDNGAWTYASVYDGDDWGEAIQIDENNPGTNADPQICSNGNGYAVTWRNVTDLTPPYDTYANIYKEESWSGDVLISNGTSEVDYPQITSNGSDYIAFWGQHDGTRDNFYYAVNDSSWNTTATLLQGSHRASVSSNIKMAVNNDDEILAVWEQADIILGRLFHDGAWGSIFTVASPAGKPDVASCGSDFMIIYVDSSFKAVSYNSSTGPGAIDELVDSFNILYPQIISSDNGYAVIWVDDILNNSLFANVYSSSSWSGASGLETDPTNSVYEPHIASDGTGYAVVWKQNNYLYSNIHVGTNWEVVKGVVSNEPDYHYHPRIASNGINYAVTFQRQTSNMNSVYAKIYNGSYWTSEQVLETTNLPAREPDIASNGTGYAVSWQQSANTGISSINCNIFNGTGWSGATPVESGTGTTYTHETRIVSNGSGYAVT